MLFQEVEILYRQCTCLIIQSFLKYSLKCDDSQRLNKYVLHLYFENESYWVITYISRIRMATSTSFCYFYGSNSSRTCDGIIYTFACTNVGVTKLF